MKTKLVIFGITGDLSRRKLLPALADIIRSGEHEDVSIIGVSRRAIDVSELLSSAGVARELADRTSIATIDLADPEGYRQLKSALDLRDDDQALLYLSVPPGAAGQIVEFLGEAGFGAMNVKLLFEKPFGFDLESAREFSAQAAQYFKEEQLYRIDHYMAKEVAQELIRLRSDADGRHHHWDNQSVSAIEVIASESIGIEDRAAFYEQTGALRDVVQGHLMQLLALVLMTPDTFTLEDVPLYRRAALQSLQSADPMIATRAQYDGYQQEVENIGSKVETFVSLKLKSDDPRWVGVPITLITGKNLAAKQTAIHIHYKDGSQDIFEEGKVTSGGRALTAYERVLVEAIKGQKAIFTTSPEVLESWRVLQSLQEAWAMDVVPLKTYQPGATIEDILK